MSATSTHRATSGFFTESRHRSALVLLVGALVMGFAVQQQVIRFYYTPLIVGLTYLTAAMAGGRKGALWAPGIVTTCWGIAVLLGVHNVVTLDSKTSYLIAGVIGIAIALTLRFTIGLAAGFIGLAVSMAIILIHDNADVPSWIFKGITFAVLLGVWGIWELRPATSRATQPPTDATPMADSTVVLNREDVPTIRV